ncbi:MAG: hypothetical protein EBW54_12575, partial [Betaproteobacteria bacterium]|nr:hypothetical protein [Betaproteobacteria bacterium]
MPTTGLKAKAARSGRRLERETLVPQGQEPLAQPGALDPLAPPALMIPAALVNQLQALITQLSDLM